MSSPFLQRCVRLPAVGAALALTLAAGVVVVAAPAAQAATSLGNGWTLYNTGRALSANMTACKNAGNQTCVGLQSGVALGHSDLLVTVDELDHLLGLPYNDSTTVPAPEGPTNEIVEVANYTPLPLFVVPGGQSAEASDAATGTLKFASPNSDNLIPAADGGTMLAFQEFEQGPSPSTLTVTSGDNGSFTHLMAVSY